MFNDASQRKFDLVLFWALDRLSREGAYQTLQHLNRLESYGVGFRRSRSHYFDSCGVFKDAVIAIMATFAKQERVKRSERTRAGLARVKASGKILGRPASVAAHKAEMIRLKASGQSSRAIGRALGISDFSVGVSLGLRYKRLSNRPAKSFRFGGLFVCPDCVERTFLAHWPRGVRVPPFSFSPPA